MKEETRLWAAKRFNIKPEDILWYNNGTCYDRIGVLTEAAAEKVREKVDGQTANGGMLDGMPLGGRSKYTNDKGVEYFDVYC